MVKKLAKLSEFAAGGVLAEPRKFAAGVVLQWRLKQPSSNSQQWRNVKRKKEAEPLEQMGLLQVEKKNVKGGELMMVKS